jgi:hypothetical protein
MKSLAEALVDLAAFLELSGDEVVELEASVRALESLAHRLQHATAEEKEAVLEVCRARANALPPHASAEEKKFYLNFGEHFGIVANETNA